MRKLLALTAVVLLPTTALAESFDQAFNMNRGMYGKDHTFTWNGKQYSTNHQEDVEASVEATQANATALVEKAKAKNAEAGAVGFEWKLTKGLIKEAEAALAEGEYQKAMNLAAQAKYHARIGIQQHEYAESNWHLSIPQ